MRGAQPGTETAARTASSSRAINEYKRPQRDTRQLSFLLHSIYGLHRYPHYLDKWGTSDIAGLREALLSALTQVDEGAARAAARDELAAAYTPTHNTLWTPEGVRSLLVPALQTVLSSASPLGALTRRAGLEEVCDGVFTLPALQPAACEALIEEAAAYCKYEEARGAASSDSVRRLVPLRSCGAGALPELLLHQLLLPLAPHLFPELPPMTWAYGYIIGYSALPASTSAHATPADGTGADAAATTAATALAAPALTGRVALDAHTDDSEITLNINLGRAFTGGELVFRHLRSDEAEGSAQTVLRPVPGTAILHRGQHLHEVTPVTAGERYALIVWFRSGSYRQQLCPCCVTHRRADCICDASWK